MSSSSSSSSPGSESMGKTVGMSDNGKRSGSRNSTLAIGRWVVWVARGERGGGHQQDGAKVWDRCQKI